VGCVLVPLIQNGNEYKCGAPHSSSIFCLLWMETVLELFSAQSAAEMSKGTYRLLTLQIFDTVLLFAGSVIYITYRPVRLYLGHAHFGLPNTN
jgi:hypothetical protein